MSQYPPQYPQYPPPYGAPQNPYGGSPAPQGPPPSPDELLAPARRAGIAMIVLGVLGVVCGLCFASMRAMINNPEVTESPQYQQLQEQFKQVEAQFHITLEQFLVYLGVIPLAIGAVLGGLGFGVRGGGRRSIVAGMVLVSFLVAGFGLFMLLGVIQLVITGAPQVMMSLCMYGIPFVLLVLTLVWLVQAVRAQSRIEWARQYHQQQLWQYQQQQQAYLQNAQQPQQPNSAPPPPPPQQPPAPGMGYHISTPPISPGESEKKDPPDAPPPQA